jgi:hypothetical protein
MFALKVLRVREVVHLRCCLGAFGWREVSGDRPR